MGASVFRGLLEKSRDENKGVTIYLPGNTIAIVVTEIRGAEAVEGRNQEFSSVVIPLDQVIAVAIS